MNPTLAALIVFTALAATQERVRPREDDERRGPDRGMIAALRSDGVMVPFAAFRGSRWSVPWPRGLRTLELPVNLESVPESWWGGWRPVSWHAWLTDGRDRTLVAQAPVLFRLHGQPRLGIRTDHAEQTLPPVPLDPFPKDGIATSGDLRVHPIEIVDRESSEWAEMTVALLAEFDRAEDTAVSGIRSAARWQHPVGRAERRALPVRLESWYRTPAGQDGSTVSYVEAVRSYPPRPEDEGCGLETLFNGWVHRAAGEPRPKVQLSARVTYCDRVGAIYMLPFGRIDVGNRLHWIFQLSGWDEEWYVVARIHAGRAEPVAEYYAGGRYYLR